jgi:hypothetical protein
MEETKLPPCKHDKIDIKNAIRDYTSRIFIILLVVFLAISIISWAIYYWLIADTKIEGLFLFYLLIVEAIGIVCIISPIVGRILLPCIIKIISLVTNLISTFLWLINSILDGIAGYLVENVIDKYFEK